MVIRSMDNKSFTIVTTTIRVPTLLGAYAQDALRFKRQIDQIIVVGDKKTPPETAAFCSELEQNLGIKCCFMSVNDQEDYLQEYSDFRDFLPWNCIQRRNVGLLLAYEGKSDIIVTIDDDNFLCQPDYLGCHAHIGERHEIEAVSTLTGWWNVCKMLDDAHGVSFYHRGYPLSQRWIDDEVYQAFTKVKGRVVANAGLWLDEPDIDALTRLCFPVRVVKTSNQFREKIACDIRTWSPFNSQNTAILRELIPAYFLFPHIGRFDDIWASYVIRHISDYMGDLVTYGSPLVRQQRNPHNYFKDFDAERFGLEHNNVFLQALQSCKLSSGSYREAFSEIAAQFPEQIIKSCGSNNVDSCLFEKVSEGFRLWSSIFE